MEVALVVVKMALVIAVHSYYYVSRSELFKSELKVGLKKLGKNPPEIGCHLKL